MLFCLMVAATLRLPDLPDIPPGVHFDEAANGILAAEIGLKGERPLFITSYTGKETLFFYLAGTMMRLVGVSTFTLRLTAAFLGILTIAATYWLGIEIFRDRRIALMAAALLTISFWHILLSRLGFRAVSQPFLQALAAAALLRGLRRGRKSWLLFGGISTGLTAYTYLAARLYPVLLLVSLLPVLANRQIWRLRWRQLLLFGSVAAATAAPLLLFFYVNPSTFWVRISQVAPGETSLSLGESFLKSLEMFFLVGDPYIRFNLPGRPLFDFFWGGLLLVGWIILVWRLYQYWPRLPDWQRIGLLLTLLAPFVMILPTALAVNEIVPSNLRAVGLIPFVFYLPAVGLMILIDDLNKHIPRLELTWTIFAIAVLALMAGGLYAQRLYFDVWGTMAETYWETDGDMTAVAAFLDQYDTTDKTIYLSSLHYRHPTLAFLSQKYGEIKWLPHSEAVVFPAGQTGLYIYPHKSPLPLWARHYFEQATLLPRQTAVADNPPFEAYLLAQPPELTMNQTVNANFGNTITLLGFDLLAGGRSSGTVSLLLYWQVQRAPGVDYTPFVHLEDAWGYRWAQVETFAYPGSQWERGDLIVQHVTVPVPDGTPPGAYRLRTGVFLATTGEQLPRLDEDGRYAGNTYSIEPVGIEAAPPPNPLPLPPNPLQLRIQPGLLLLGYERNAFKLTTGENLDLALWWSADAPLPETINRFELYHPDKTGRALGNVQPVHDTFPFTAWDTPIFLIDRQSLPIPDDLSPGDYRLLLRMMNKDSETLATADLGPLSVEATERLFTPPDSQYPMDATFGEEIKLIGYDLKTAGSPDTYQLTLVWQALTQPAADYTVFVHLLQPDQSCTPCIWQQDVMPQQCQYPTSRWRPGEVVVDEYQIVLPEGTPPGEYPLEVGLYISETGQRLRVVVPYLPDGDAVALQSMIRVP